MLQVGDVKDAQPVGPVGDEGIVSGQPDVIGIPGRIVIPHLIRFERAGDVDDPQAVLAARHVGVISRHGHSRGILPCVVESDLGRVVGILDVDHANAAVIVPIGHVGRVPHHDDIRRIVHIRDTGLARVHRIGDVQDGQRVGVCHIGIVSSPG